MFLHIWILTLSWHVIIVLTWCGDCEVVFDAEGVCQEAKKKKNLWDHNKKRQSQLNNQQRKLNPIQCFCLLCGLFHNLRQQMTWMSNTLIFDLQNCHPIPDLLHMGDSPNLPQKHKQH